MADSREGFLLVIPANFLTATLKTVAATFAPETCYKYSHPKEIRSNIYADTQKSCFGHTRNMMQLILDIFTAQMLAAGTSEEPL